MAMMRKPQDNQSVQEPRQGGGALDRSTGPALGLFESEMTLGFLKSDFNGPTAGIPGEDVLGGPIGVRGEKGLGFSTGGNRLHCHKAKQALAEGGIPQSEGIDHTHTVPASVNIQRNSMRSMREPLSRRRQTLTPLAGAASRFRFARRRRVKQLRVQMQPTGEIPRVGQGLFC